VWLSPGGSLKVWLTPDLCQEKCTMILEYLVITVSKQMLNHANKAKANNEKAYQKRIEEILKEL
jgi:hypothetical protein